jgi:hypothetical protein
MQKAGGVSREEEIEMRRWLGKACIGFELTRFDFDRSIEFKLVDYKHKCLIASKKYFVNDAMLNVGEVEEMLKKFEVEEIYPLLFGGLKLMTIEELAVDTRLIRED